MGSVTSHGFTHPTMERSPFKLIGWRPGFWQAPWAFSTETSRRFGGKVVFLHSIGNAQTFGNALITFDLPKAFLGGNRYHWWCWTDARSIVVSHHWLSAFRYHGMKVKESSSWLIHSCHGCMHSTTRAMPKKGNKHICSPKMDENDPVWLAPIFSDGLGSTTN